jgi:hypothetical protein
VVVVSRTTLRDDASFGQRVRTSATVNATAATPIPMMAARRVNSGWPALPARRPFGDDHVCALGAVSANRGGWSLPYELRGTVLPGGPPGGGRIGWGGLGM